MDSEVYWDRNDKAGLGVYVSKIKEAAGIRNAIVLVSAHEPVRQALLEKGVKFVRVHPPLGPPESREAKQAFLEREVSDPPVLRACVRAFVSLQPV